jgi:hypothetical protein
MDLEATGPPKAKRAPAKSALRNTELLAAYRLLPVLQARPLEKLNGAHAVAWEKEAARLFREFWRTGNQKHLRAFFTHVVAMRGHRARLAR